MEALSSKGTADHESLWQEGIVEIEAISQEAMGGSDTAIDYRVRYVLPKSNRLSQHINSKVTG